MRAHAQAGVRATNEKTVCDIRMGIKLLLSGTICYTLVVAVQKYNYYKNLYLSRSADEIELVIFSH